MNSNDYKEYFKTHIKEIYDFPEKTKIVLFKNPFKYLVSFIEDINPTHIKIIYGKKRNNKSNYEKIAKIILPSIILSEILVMSYYIINIYLSLFSISVIFAYYITNCNKLFNLIELYYEYFNNEVNNDKSNKHNNWDLWLQRGWKNNSIDLFSISRIN